MEYIASISYGKDSLAMLEVIHRNGLPLDRIVTVEIWATKEIPADFPEMMEFKAKADRIILEKYGKVVEHITENLRGLLLLSMQRRKEPKCRENIRVSVAKRELVQFTTES